MTRKTELGGLLLSLADQFRRRNLLVIVSDLFTDLDALYTALSDLASRGDYFPLSLMSETTFKREFHAHGFWSNDSGRLLIWVRSQASDCRALRPDSGLRSLT